MYYIYEMLHVPSSRRYIGQHRPKRNSKDYTKDGYYGSGKIWRSIYKKHPEECQKKILQFVETKEEADEREIYYIAEYKRKYGELCVNILKGGGGGYIEPKVYTEEELQQRKEHIRTRERLYWSKHKDKMHANQKRYYEKHKEHILEYQSNYQQENPEKCRARAKRWKEKRKENKEFVWSDERRQHQSAINTLENNPFYGKKHSEESRMKMRQAWERRRAKKLADNPS